MPARDESVLLGRLKKRAEFLFVRGGQSWRAASLVLQARKRNGSDDGAKLARFGFTATKRLGNAVERNRARRRLKETVRLLGEDFARPGYDYVVIARQGALTRSFGDIGKDLGAAFRHVHQDKQRQA